MRLDVYFTPNEVKPADTVGRLVAIVDVLRASTTVATALGNGAKTVIPLLGADDVITRSKEFSRSGVKLAGEQRMLPIAGFDLGNSPQAFTTRGGRGENDPHHYHQRNPRSIGRPGGP